MANKAPMASVEAAREHDKGEAVRVAFVLEGGRSREDHAALLQVAAALGREGAETPILHHGLGRLAVLRLRQALRKLRPELILTTGAASTRDVRRVATALGCPLVCYCWPEGPVHNIHDRHDRVHTRGHAETQPEKDRVQDPGSAARRSAARPPARPTRVVVGTQEQRQSAAHYFAQGDPTFSLDRVHVLPTLPEPPAVGRGAQVAPPAAANAAALAEHTALLWEALAERSHRSLGRGLLRGVVARAARFGSRPPSLSLAYHQVVRDLRGFDLNLIVAEGTLERHVQALLRRGYQPLTVAAQAEQLLTGRAAGAPPTFSLSFDDGYVDTLTIAAPLLSALGVPFTVYIITDVASGVCALPWYELLAHALLDPDARPRALAVLPSEPALRALCTSQATRPPPQLAQAVLAACKALPGARRDTLISALWTEVGARVRALPHTPRYLDAEGVRKLRGFGAELSSHTRSHPILPTLTDQALRDELQGSREALRRILLAEGPDSAANSASPLCPGLAYPNGDSDERVRAAAQAAGYQYAVAVTPQPGAPSRYSLGRRMLSELSGLGLTGRFSEDVLWARMRGTF